MTSWTKEQYEELSKKVAEKFGISHLCYITITEEPTGRKKHYSVKPVQVCLHESWQIVMELCVKHGVYAYHDGLKATSVDHDGVEALCYRNDIWTSVFYEDHNNDKSLAERVARMLALLEVEL